MQFYFYFRGIMELKCRQMKSLNETEIPYFRSFFSSFEHVVLSELFW